jgi:hypothetical protein
MGDADVFGDISTGAAQVLGNCTGTCGGDVGSGGQGTTNYVNKHETSLSDSYEVAVSDVCLRLEAHVDEEKVANEPMVPASSGPKKGWAPLSGRDASTLPEAC